jgi:hypothetical protein
LSFLEYGFDLRPAARLASCLVFVGDGSAIIVVDRINESVLLWIEFTGAKVLN